MSASPSDGLAGAPPRTDRARRDAEAAPAHPAAALTETAEGASNGHRPAAPADRAVAASVDAAAASTQPVYIGLVTRAIAFVVDAAIIDTVAALLAVSVAAVISLLPVSHKHNSVLIAVGGVLFVVWAALYFVVFWSTTGQTPGSRLMRIRVTRTSGAPLRPRHAIIRLAGVVVAIVPLCAGLLPILFTPRRRGLQDWLAGTVVVLAPAVSR
jgi:uncharacterized RDD family membrane protein YckC